MDKEQVAQTLRYRFHKLYKLSLDKSISKDARTISRIQARMYELEEVALMLGIVLGDPWEVES